jgi:hypothetical protein
MIAKPGCHRLLLLNTMGTRYYYYGNHSSLSLIFPAPAVLGYELKLISFGAVATEPGLFGSWIKLGQDEEYREL